MLQEHSPGNFCPWILYTDIVGIKFHVFCLFLLLFITAMGKEKRNRRYIRINFIILRARSIKFAHIRIVNQQKLQCEYFIVTNIRVNLKKKDYRKIFHWQVCISYNNLCQVNVNNFRYKEYLLVQSRSNSQLL